MKLRLIAILLCSILYFSACSQQPKNASGTEQKPQYELASPADFQKKMASEPGVLLDVRTPSEQSKGIIKGAVAMDLFADNFESEIDKLDKTKTYYVYCAAGGRSLEACELMQKKGFSHVVDLDGGMKQWMKEGLPVERN